MRQKADRTLCAVCASVCVRLLVYIKHIDFLILPTVVVQRAPTLTHTEPGSSFPTRYVQNTHMLQNAPHTRTEHVE